jgi:hypothetical protein
VLEAEELPAGVTDLDTSLTDVNGNNFSHDEELYEFFEKGKIIIITS